MDTEILTAKHLFNLVESVCSSNSVSAFGYTIVKLENTGNNISFRVSCDGKFYLISKTIGIETCIYKYESCGSDYGDIVNSVESSYIELRELFNLK